MEFSQPPQGLSRVHNDARKPVRPARIHISESGRHDASSNFAHARSHQRTLEALDHFPSAELQPVRISACARVLEGPALLAHQAADELDEDDRISPHDGVAAALRDLCHRQAVPKVLELEVARRRRRGCGNRGAGDEPPPR